MSTPQRPDQYAYRVLMTSGVFEPGFRGGGPIRSIAAIMDSAPSNIDLTLVTLDRDLGCSTPYPGLSGKWVNRGSAKVFYLNRNSVRDWFSLLRDLRRTRFDLLYTSGLWAPATTVLPILLAAARLIKVSAIVIAPRGELARGALSIKSTKKRIILSPWRQLLKRLKTGMHATAEHEAQDIANAFPWATVYLSKGDASNMPTSPLPPTSTPPELDASLVYLSRIAPVKNLDIALDAMREVSRKMSFHIYGPIEDLSYWEHCERIIRSLPSNVEVTYCGEVEPSQVRATFGRYDAFVFPTRGENFGHVIAESLSASCPVICTDMTPWSNILRRGGGVVVSDLQRDLTKQIMRVSSMTPQERQTARMLAGEAYYYWRQSLPRDNILENLRNALSGTHNA